MMNHRLFEQENECSVLFASDLTLSNIPTMHLYQAKWGIHYIVQFQANSFLNGDCFTDFIQPFHGYETNVSIDA